MPRKDAQPSGRLMRTDCRALGKTQIHAGSQWRAWVSWTDERTGARRRDHRRGPAARRRPPGGHHRWRLRRSVRGSRAQGDRVPSPSSTVRTIMCSARCCTRWRPPSWHPARSPSPCARCSGASRTPRCCWVRRSTSTRWRARSALRTAPRSPYDSLIVATGTRHSWFGHDDWEPLGTGPQDHRRCARHPAARPARLRARRAGD